MRRRTLMLAGAILLVVLLRGCPTPEKPVPTPTRRAAGPYTYFFPQANRQGGIHGHGVGITSPINAALKADWYYTWSYCQSPCIPMNRNAVVPQGWCAPAQLLFNEPTNPDPFAGYKISVEDAVGVSHAIRQECPNTYIISVNAYPSQEGLNWARDYISLGGEFNAIGFHSYCETSRDCIEYIEWVRRNFQEPLCLTEYGTISDDPGDFKVLLDYIPKRLDCSAAFTTYWPETPSLSLQNSDGSLTAKGKIFSDRHQ